ncbi:MAG: polymer-forming cytoskeletal protein [Acidobacteria bacterium]|nr:polymer-forming cytoskeletal protein [Acidobacteriota bacterium]
MALFGKIGRPPEEEKKNSPAPAPASPAPAPFFRPSAAKIEGRATSVIGKNIRIQGELSGDEDVAIEGKVEGKINLTKTLKISEGAQVNAEVKAHYVTVAGRVVGNVTATEKVEILPTGSLEGNIRSPKIAIAEGAQFKGSVDMGGKTPSENPGTAGGGTSHK